MQSPAMKPFTSRLQDARPCESFTDVAELDGTTVWVHHRLPRWTHAGDLLRGDDWTGRGRGRPEGDEGSTEVLRSLKHLAEGVTEN